MSDSARKASEIESKPVRWLWGQPIATPEAPGLIARGVLNVVGGRPDQGKGLFGAHIAADVSTGTGLAAKDIRGTGGKVIFSAAEDDDSFMTKPRLEAAGANLDKVMLWKFVLPRDGQELETLLRTYKPDLLIMDPFSAHLSGVSKFSDKIRDILSPLSRIIEETGTAIVIIEHALKKVKKHGHPLDALGGSGSGLPAACRMAYLFGVHPDDDDQRVLAPAKANLRERPKALAFEVDVTDMPVVGTMPSLQRKEELESFDPLSLVVVDKSEPGSGPGRKPDKRAAAAEWLTTKLLDAEGPIKAGVLIEDAKQSGITTKTLRRAAEDIRVVKNPPEGGRNCKWDLPDETKKVLGVKTTVEVVDDVEPPHEEPRLASEVTLELPDDIDAEFSRILDKPEEAGDE